MDLTVYKKILCIDLVRHFFFLTYLAIVLNYNTLSLPSKNFNYNCLLFPIGECLHSDELKWMFDIGMDKENNVFLYKKYAHFICFDANFKITKRTWSSGYTVKKKMEGEDENAEDKKSKLKHKKGKKGEKGKKGGKGKKSGKGKKKGKKGGKKRKKGKKKKNKSDIVDDEYDNENEELLDSIAEVPENTNSQDVQEESGQASRRAGKTEKKKKTKKRKGKKKK